MLARILAMLEEQVSGADLETVRAATGEAPDRVLATVESALADGILERWPFWPQRIRATGLAASVFLRELAELRRDALTCLERISEVSRWPATLHLVVPGAHAVVERFPWHGDLEAIAREQARYATPRPLTQGATALAIVAHLPEVTRAALAKRREAPEDPAELLAVIRHQGYCLRPAQQVADSWVLSAPLRAADGMPYGALCTYGTAAAVPEQLVAKSAEIVRASAAELSQRAARVVLVQRACAVFHDMTRGL
jgi:DNA-binding IclR family transcriptional regulator